MDENKEVNTTDPKREKVRVIPLSAIDDAPDHPFGVRDDEEMAELMKSIADSGVLAPALARPKDGGGYELISGHRRLAACKALGMDAMPVIVRDLTDEEAVITMVDSNLQREHILPSEKAFAYKMKYDALKHQGTSSQLGTKLRTDELLAQNSSDSRNQIQRYIRLTHLIPDILKLVDEGKIALTPAVELSYLTGQEQQDLLETMESEDCTPSLSQAVQLKKLSQSGELTMDRIFEILREPKANQQEKISFRVDDLRKYFPKSFSNSQIEDEIVKLCEVHYKRRQRQQER